MKDTYYLIVEQSTQPPEDFQNLLKLLSTEFKLDIFQCRQRLIGKGLSLLAKGPEETLNKIARHLAQRTISYRVICPAKPTFAPQRIRSLERTADNISFSCQKKTVTFPKKAQVLAVFADLSGGLASKSVKHLLTNMTYRGKDYIEHLQDDKIFQAILQGSPVLDLYLLNEDNSISDAVRVFPGKFDPKGLGDKATLSSRQNLKAILDLMQDTYAAEMTLKTDFGLVNFPGCTLNRDNPDDPEVLRRNLISLTRYGWLMADIVQADQKAPAPQEKDPELAALSAPLLTATGMTATEPLFNSIQETLTEEVTASGHNQSQPAEVKKPTSLPAPPEGSIQRRWNTPAFWLSTAGSGAVGLFFAVFEVGHSATFRQLFRQAFTAGILPFTAALLMSWYGFYCLRMKRQIENTPTSRVRSVAMGMVEVKGRAIRKFALVSPMSHVACAYYRLTRYRRGKNNRWEVSSVSSSHHVPFLLEDDTGRIEIDPASCRVRAGTRQEGMPGQVGLFHVDTDSHEKWVEETIVEGTLLYVLGYASVKRIDGPTLSERKQQVLRELKQNPHVLNKYDTDGDGHISADEWDAARADVEDTLYKESLRANLTRKKQEEHIVIGKRKGRPLLISETHSEDLLTARYLTYSIPLFIAAGALTAFSIYLLLQYLR